MASTSWKSFCFFAHKFTACCPYGKSFKFDCVTLFIKYLLRQQTTTIENPRRIATTIGKFKAMNIVISGPSGGGKSTILARAIQEYGDAFAFSVSHTTRKPRNGEIDGVHYYFINRKLVEKMVADGEFYESAEFGGNFYGTSKKSVSDIEKSGKICVLDVDLNGEQRLRIRGSETEESLKKRLKHAEEDLEAVEQDSTLFDRVIVNDDLDRAYDEFINVITPYLVKIGVKNP